MKDSFGNKYVKPAACAHPGCPPWKCLQFDPSRLAPPRPEPSFMRNMSPERRAQIQREYEERNLALEAHRKKHSSRRLIHCAILTSLPGLGLFLMLQQAGMPGSTFNNALVGFIVSLVLLGFLYPMSLLLIGLPPAPDAGTRQSSPSR